MINMTVEELLTMERNGKHIAPFHIYDPGSDRGARFLREPFNGYVRDEDDAHWYSMVQFHQVIRETVDDVVRRLIIRMNQPEVQPQRVGVEAANKLEGAALEQRCRIWHINSGYWTSIPCEGYTKDRRRGAVTTIAVARDRRLTEGEHFMEIVPRVQFESIATKQLADLARLAPNSVQVKGMIVAVFGCMPPENQTFTFEQLKEWVETNSTVEVGYTPPKPTEVAVNLTPEQRALLQQPAVGPQATLTIPLTFSDVERGRACYSVARHGSGNILINRGDIEEFMSESGGVRELIDELRCHISDNAWECEPEMEEVGEAIYERIETEDHSDRDHIIELSDGRLREEVLSFIRQNFTPDELEEVGFEMPPAAVHLGQTDAQGEPLF